MTAPTTDPLAQRRAEFMRWLYAPRPDTRPPHQRHRGNALLGMVLSVGRIPWLRAPIGTKIEWPKPKKYKTPLDIKCLPPAT